MRLRLAIITLGLTLPIAALALYRRSTRPTEAPDAVSAGWAYYINSQVAIRDGERAAYLQWVRSL